jgi:FMN phosphatase YigB (HAD superfamily)
VTIRAVFFDLGGVILRTEFESPRQHLAERLNIEYQDLVRLVFECETSRLAFLGK